MELHAEERLRFVDDAFVRLIILIGEEDTPIFG